MRQSYLDYAMSVIIGRALPDVRDGLKPVHRRILYAMHEQGNTFDKPYKKSARIVGDVIGKYHPHGDSAVYDAIVRMVQDFSMRAPLIDGQGNFGSVDGDNAAAMRYTEIRLARVANEMLADIDKETVDWAPNYDESLLEPVVLPTRVPNMLLNGSSGIAVGMATNIPPHNLTELCNGLIALLENPDIGIDELMEHIPGPDFPTAGFIHGKRAIREAYETGRGVIRLRARAHFETGPNDRQMIVVTELPYQVNKARLQEKIAELVKDKKLEGISDLRDESDRDGMRLVIFVKRGEQPEIVLNRLYKQTALQTSFGINAVALHDGRPRLMPLKDMLQAFLSHREEVVLRRSRYELRKARERAHILEGLVKALDQLDAVIELIRASADGEAARNGLMETFGFSEVQARAILDMRLQRLTGLERDKIIQEYQDVLARIRELEEILASRDKVLAIIGDEIREIRDAYGDERRTEIVEAQDEIRMEDLIADDEMVVVRTHRGYIKRLSLDEFRQQRRGGKGKTGIGTRDEDWVEDLFVARAHSMLLFFTDHGQVHWLKVWQVPEAGRAARGLPIVNLLELGEDEKVSAVVPVREFDPDTSLLFVTRNGVVKRTELVAYSRPRASGIHAIRLDEGDTVVSVFPVTDEHQAVLVTHGGQAIRFRVTDVRLMGRVARGVRGIDLADGDYVVGGFRAEPDIAVLTISERGYGKRTAIDEYRLQGRGGKGIIAMRLTDKTGKLVGAMGVYEDDQVMLVTDT
ncbi:MAG: DNA gyrase subunit A, partial [Candidatus Dadabacteria bacterium]